MSEKKSGEYVSGTKPGTNEVVHGRVANTNGLMDGYARVYPDGGGKVQVVHVAKDESSRRK